MYNIDNIKIGEQIKKFRESRNISLTHLSKLISKSKSTISKYENGIVTPDIITILEICNALNIELNDLFTLSIKKERFFPENKNLLNTSKLYFYYYTENHLIKSIAELTNNKNLNVIKIRFYNGIKNVNKYANQYAYYYEGELTYDKNVGYINLKNINFQGTQYENIQISFNIPWNNDRDKTFFFICALTPHSVPVVKKGILSINEITNIHEYDRFLKITKDELNKIKYNNYWILNDSNYDDLFFTNN